MADPRSAPVLPASGEFVYVPVPSRDYAAVVQFLVERVLARRDVGPATDPGAWDDASVRRLHDDVAGMPLEAVLDALASAAPRYVGFDELAETTGLGAPRLRAQLASLTKLATAAGLPNPLRSRSARAGAPTTYQLPAALASAWSGGGLGSTSR
jgi:hypothetical protein